MSVSKTEFSHGTTDRPGTYEVREKNKDESNDAYRVHINLLLRS